MLLLKKNNAMNANSASRLNRYLRQGLLVALVTLLFSGAHCLAYDRRTPIVEAVAKAGPAVVNIRTEQIVKRRSSPFFGFTDPFF